MHSPLIYELMGNVFFFGRRAATFRRLLEVAAVQPGQRVLDVGCGTGYFARLIARRVGPTGRVVGVDAAPEMIAYARRRSRRLGNCEFEVGTAEALPLPGDQFDVVVSSLFIHHLPEDLRVQALREMLRVLRPGGTLLVADGEFGQQGLRGHVLTLFGHGAMVRKIAPDLRPLVAEAGFSDLQTGDARPWMRFVRALKPASTMSARSNMPSG